MVVRGGSGRVHEVLGGPLTRTCDCPDFIYRRRGRCKHTEWVASLEVLGRSDDMPFESSVYELFEGDELPTITIMAAQERIAVRAGETRVDCELMRLWD